MTTEGTKEEIKLHTEIIKFLMVVLLAAAGGMVTLYNIDNRTHSQEILITLGWLFIPLLLIGVLALFLYIYSLLKKI
jgi:TRAP-type C4-dicarboxylate transport system permease small subunit